MLLPSEQLRQLIFLLSRYRTPATTQSGKSPVLPLTPNRRKSAAHRQKPAEVRSAKNPTGSVLPAPEAAKLTAETTIQTPAKTLQTGMTVQKTLSGRSSMIRTVRSTKLRLTVPDFWANAGQTCTRTRLSYFLFSELFSILFNKLNSEGIRA